MTVLTPYPAVRSAQPVRRHLRLVRWDRQTGSRLIDRKRILAEEKESSEGPICLARLASIAGRIEPQLLRALRLRLAPYFGADAEGDLWFSDMVESAAHTGLILRPNIQRILQDELASYSDDLLESAWEVLYQARTNIPWTRRHEVKFCTWLMALEELTYLGLKGIDEAGPERNAAELRLRQILKTLLTPTDRACVADAILWTKAAHLRLPPSVHRFEPTRHLLLGVKMRAKGALPASAIRDVARLTVPRYLVPSGLSNLSLWIRLIEGGVELSLDPLVNAHEIQVPPVAPLEITVGWLEDEVLRQVNVLLAPPRSTVVHVNVDQAEIALPDGAHYRISLDPDRIAGPTDTPLGFLEGLKGTWTGAGFNVIWRPNSTPGQDRFLELNLTEETLRFEEIPGPITNRGFLQPDINMFGLLYLQTIADANIKSPDGKPAGLHLETGVWTTVPQTEHPQEVPTVVRMASIPHGTTVLAQGVASRSSEGPHIQDINITPFQIGNPGRLVAFPESNLADPSQYRTPPEGLVGIDQAIVNNPNLVLKRALEGKTVKNTVVLDVSSDTSAPVFGGGLANTAFLQGSPNEGPNAQAALVRATFWIETVEGPVADDPDFHQLQYTQTVLLNFHGLSWPHITVATLLRSVPYTVQPGDTLSAVALQFYGNGTEPLWRKIYNANIAVIGPDPNVITAGQRLNIPM
jgi:hypothetical protein